MLKSIALSGFKSFGRKVTLDFTSPIAAIVGPNGSGKSNVAEGFRFVLGEQSMKSLRSRKGEDLIWGGSPGLPRANRASVKVLFDNSKRLLDIDYPEVEIERVVYRDGVNEYSINGTKVRLKDVSQLLAGANIGSSGYHIISQGEADRVLTASARERREMIEEALGLKLFQYKKTESERKLEETAQNKSQVESLKRELAPHLKFLRKQVERIEKARELAEELGIKLADYLAREDAYIGQETARLREMQRDLQGRVKDIQQVVDAAERQIAGDVQETNGGNTAEVQQLGERLAEARRVREEAARALGRAEGELEAANAATEKAETQGVVAVPVDAVRSFVSDLNDLADEVRKAVEPSAMQSAYQALQRRVSSFVDHLGGLTPAAGAEDLVHTATQKMAEAAKVFEVAQGKESALQQELEAARSAQEESREAHHTAERELITRKSELREVQSRLSNTESRLADMTRLREQFEAEVREGIVLIGAAVQQWKSASWRKHIPEGALSEDRGKQEDRRREIERLKIKIEEYGAGNSDEVVKEFNQTLEREQFLERELADLTQSETTLRQIIEDLDAKIDERFQEGLKRINDEFNTFFTQLFGGGSAKLDLERVRKQVTAEGSPAQAGEMEEEEPVAGLSVTVQLPRKRVSGLEVLSGGERALTSIALIFAMSQVNPPPFLILDETDAALDEANSKRYATIVESLAKRSQLILITHNRATMSAAEELYGVTMGADGVSKLLSVKLSEAEAVAK